MKQFFTILITTIFLNFNAQTNVPGGNLTGTLTLAGSPYLVQGHVMVPPNNLLKIDPGVIIEFQGHYKLNVQGRLLARGTVNDTIQFRVPANLQNSGWWGIRFEMTGATQDSSILEYCKIKYGKANGNGDDYCGGGVFIKNFSKVRVSHCIINQNSAFFGCGIFIHWASPVIDHNEIRYNTTLIGMGGVGGAGICCDSIVGAKISHNVIAGNYLPFSGYGGAIRCDNASPSILTNTIVDNWGDVNGAGIGCFNFASPLISGNMIGFNSGGNGAGILCDSGASPDITGNTIYSNAGMASGSFPAYGGGLLITGIASNPTIRKNIIRDNSAKTRGGGLEVLLSTAAIRDNTVHANLSGSGGGISLEGGSDVVLSGNVITNNQATSGGGIAVSGNPSSCIITNNLIANNTTDSNGGGITCNGMSPVISNCTIVNNLSNTAISNTTSAFGGGGLYLSSACNATLSNCIVYGNSTGSNNGHQVYLDDNASDPPVYNSDIQGGSAAFYTNGSLYSGTYTNNIAAPPGFVSPSGGTGSSFNGLTANWRVTLTSPCVNSGKQDTTGLFLPALDLAGNSRITGYVDMGVYESGSCAGFQVNTNIIHQAPGLFVNTPGMYQWLNCSNGFSPIAGQSGAAFTPTANGSYAVAITQSGCKDTTGCFSFSTLSVKDELRTGGINVYPNPSSGEIHITGLNPEHAKVELINGLSQVLVVIEATNGIADLMTDHAGVYFLRISQPGAIYLKKIVVYR